MNPPTPSVRIRDRVLIALLSLGIARIYTPAEEVTIVGS
jgi:hypothetical protein